MTNASMEERYIFGSDDRCDVVIKDDSVVAKHGELVQESGVWVFRCIDGRIGRRGQENDPIAWFHREVHVRPADDLWLSDRVRMPWPVEANAVRIFTVGRANDCDITINREGVSGRHAILLVGPRGTCVLRDTNSRNGIFSDHRLTNRVSSIMVLPGKQVFLASQAVQSSKLFPVQSNESAVEQMPEKSSADPPSFGATPQADSSVSSLGIKIALCALPTVFCAIGLWLWSKQLPSGNLTPPNASQGLSKSIPAQPIEASLTSDVAEAMLSSELKSQTAASTNLISPQASLYWIMVRHSQSDVWFRLGSGTAVSSDTIATCASVLRTMDELLSGDYSDPAAVAMQGGEVIPLVERTVWDEFIVRDRHASILRQQFEQLRADDANGAELKLAAESVNFAMEAASATDVGWVRVSTQLQPLELADDVNLLPGSALTAIDASFDALDPAYAPIQGEPPSRIENVRYRIQSVGPSINSVDGLIKLHEQTDVVDERNQIGMSLMRGPKVVGIIVYQDTTEGDARIVEAISSRTLRKAIFTE
ncbi:FHA domain-containing protein [Rubripirellula amarantea]|nr:FHA domain-containing protein [Rubripirellula amarantea]